MFSFVIYCSLLSLYRLEHRSLGGRGPVFRLGAHRPTITAGEQVHILGVAISSDSLEKHVAGVCVSLSCGNKSQKKANVMLKKHYVKNISSTTLPSLS